VRLYADVKWTDCSSATRMRKHLGSFVCSKKSNLNRIFKGSTPPSPDQVEVSVKCGKVAERSSFVFLRGSRNKSLIVGICSTNYLVDLIHDFDFLEEHMNKSNLAFTLSDPKITLDNNKLFEKADKGFLQIKSVLAQFFGIVGFISGASAYFLFGENTQVSLISLILGGIFLFGSLAIECWNQPKYFLID